MLLWILFAITVVLVMTMIAGRIRDARTRRQLDRSAARLDQIMRGLVHSERPPSAH